MKTTLNQIKAKKPCTNGYKKLLTFLGKTEADDEVLDLSTILESNGFLDTIWCFRAVSGFDKEMRLFAVFCARQVQHLIKNQYCIDAIDVSERYAHGQATVEELKTARAAANAAASARAADSAYSAADSAAAYAAYSTAASNAANAVNAAEIKPVLETYLKNLLLETEK